MHWATFAPTFGKARFLTQPVSLMIGQQVWVQGRGQQRRGLCPSCEQERKERDQLLNLQMG